MGPAETTNLNSTAGRARQSGTPPGLHTSLQYVKGVGPRRAAALARKQLQTVEDALFFVPLRHEDRTRLTALRDLQPGQTQTCSGVIVGLSPPPPGRSRVPFSVMLRDQSGYVTASWFGGAYLSRVLKRGQRLVLHGRIARFRGAITLQNPDYEVVESDDEDRLHTGRLVPVYSTTEGLPQRPLRRLMWQIVDAFAAEVVDPVPEAVRTRRALDRKSTRLNSSHIQKSRMPSSA